MKPFCVFRAPDKMKWNYRPTGKNRYRVVVWHINNGEKITVDISPKKPCTMSELMTIIQDGIDTVTGECDDYGFEAYVWG